MLILISILIVHDRSVVSVELPIISQLRQMGIHLNLAHLISIVLILVKFGTGVGTSRGVEAEPTVDAGHAIDFKMVVGCKLPAWQLSVLLDGLFLNWVKSLELFQYIPVSLVVPILINKLLLELLLKL